MVGLVAIRSRVTRFAGRHWLISWPLALLACSSALAQSAASLADGRHCSRVVEVRSAEVRDSVTRETATADGARAAFLRGCLAMGDGRTDDAVTAFKRAAQLRDEDAVFHLWLSRA